MTTSTTNALPDILPAVNALSRTDKLRLIELLAADLIRGDLDFDAGAAYPVWTPLEAYDAADALLHELERDKSTP